MSEVILFGGEMCRLRHIWHFHRVLLEAKGVKVYKCRCQRAFVQILEQDEETAGETTIFDYMKGAIPKFLQNVT